MISVGGAVVIGGEGGGAPLSNATPAALGTAAAGVATSASRADHVHAMPTAAQVGALAVTELNKPVDGLDMDGNVIEGLAEPTADDHAATKGYVDALVAGATVAAADITDATAAGRALITAAPSTLAAQARLVASVRRGPVAFGGWSDSNYVGAASAPAGAAQPSIIRGSSFVLTVYAPTNAAGTGAHLAVSSDGTSRGWLLAEGGGGGAAGPSDLTLYSWSGALGVPLPNAIATAGWHAVAVSISAGGAVRYSVDGAAAAAGVGAPTLNARNGDNVRLGRGIGTLASGGATGVAYLGIWASVLSDADLVALAASPSAGAPALPSAPAWEWAAAAHLGGVQPAIGGIYYVAVGAPALWMP